MMNTSKVQHTPPKTSDPFKEMLEDLMWSGMITHTELGSLQEERGFEDHT